MPYAISNWKLKNLIVLAMKFKMLLQLRKSFWKLGIYREPLSSTNGGFR